jgi:hypothetical protein
VTGEQAGRVLALATMQGTNAESLTASSGSSGRTSGRPRGPAGCGSWCPLPPSPVCRTTASRSTSASPRGLDYYTGTIYETSCSTCRRSAASAPAAGTTTWPACTPSRSSPGSGRRSGSTGCWPRWRSEAPWCGRPVDPGRRAGPPVRRRPARRLPTGGPGVAGGRGGREVYPEAKKLKAPVRVRRQAGVPAGPDRRPRECDRRLEVKDLPGGKRHVPTGDRPFLLRYSSGDR